MFRGFYASFRHASAIPAMMSIAAPIASAAMCTTSKSDAARNAKEAEERSRQLAEAVEWCEANGCKGYASSHRVRDDGEWWWPSVTEGSLSL